MDLATVKKVHFIGIGGIGMSALAWMMLQEGKHVTGSDRDTSDLIDKLSDAGVEVYRGHRASNVAADTDLVVYTKAIPEDNPEYLTARERKISMLSYPELLGMVSATKKTIAVSGTHGKTTTTAMVATIMIEAGYDPTVVVGSMLLREQSNFIAGKSDYFVAEACEYKRSFLELYPYILIITNIEEDHLDYYRDLADIQAAFSDLIQHVPADGFIICNPHDTAITPVLKNARATIIDYRPYQDTTLAIPGAHNQLNAAAASAAVDQIGITPAVAHTALRSFQGTWRRFEFKGTLPHGALVYDDYAHHPTELKALFSGTREQFPDKKIVAVFQPHLYSRTLDLFSDFSHSFNQVDQALIAPVYEARQESVEAQPLHYRLAEAIGSTATAYDSFPEIVEALGQFDDAQHVILIVGAGDIYQVSNMLPLKQNS